MKLIRNSLGDEYKKGFQLAKLDPVCSVFQLKANNKRNANVATANVLTIPGFLVLTTSGVSSTFSTATVYSVFFSFCSTAILSLIIW